MPTDPYTGAVPQPGDTEFVGPVQPAPTVRDKLRRRFRASQKSKGSTSKAKTKKPNLRDLLRQASER